MKKIISAVLALCMLLVCTVSFCSCSGRNTQLEALRTQLDGKLTGDYTNNLSGTTLNVYNWGQYISDGADDSIDVNLAFEAVTGIHVNYVTYDSNESMYAIMSSGSVSYDIVIPSDYMIERMIGEGLLQKLDFSKLSNYKYTDAKYKDLYFDQNNEYSVPYSAGYVGVIYNKTMVDEADAADKSWSLLWNSKYTGQIMNFDNARDALATAMYYLGIDVNTTDKADWDSAAAKLTEEKPMLQTWVMDDIFQKMEGGNAAIAPYYVGDFVTMQEENGDLEFYYPKEGTNVFVDSVCVPACAENYDAAMLYINFLMEPEIALANAEYIYYATPNTAVLENDEYSLKGNEYVYPAEEIEATYYHDISPEVRSYYEDLWKKVKA